MEWKWVSTRVLKFLKFTMQPVNVFASTEVDRKIFAVKIFFTSCLHISYAKKSYAKISQSTVYSYMYKDDWNVAVAHSFALFSLGD